jgi:sulfur transfer protein SufE
MACFKIRTVINHVESESIMSTNNASAEAEAIADEFGFFDDWEDRYQMLIDQGPQIGAFARKISA